MIPLYIAGCFSVLHPGRGKRGALICGALSDQALNCVPAPGIPGRAIGCRGHTDAAAWRITARVIRR